MDEKQWRREAKRYSLHIWMYEDLIDDHPEATEAAFASGENPYDFVERLGDKYGLDRVDQDWGFNAGKKFSKAEAA